MKAEINFYNIEVLDFNIDELSISKWISEIINSYYFKYSEINFTFYTDEELLKLNKKYLNHDFYTDIITFDNTINKTISADIALSYERIKSNAKEMDIPFENELFRVMIHGILHCIGYNDDTSNAKLIMRQQEDKALNMFHVERKISINNV